MNIAELRKRYGAALQRARDLEKKITEADDPSAEDQAALDLAVNEAKELRSKIEAHNARSSALSDLEAFGNTTDWTAPVIQMPYNDASNTRGGRHAFSVVRAIQGQLDAIYGRGGLTGIELETHQELVKRRGQAATGVMIPLDAPLQYRGAMQYRDLTTAAGAGAIPKPVETARMIDILRPRMVFESLGVSVITDMTQPFGIPKTTTTVTPGHVTTEGVKVANSDPAIGSLDFTYKSVEASTKLTRQFINTASISAESYVIDQMTATISRVVENEAFNGPGTTKRVKGLFNYTGGDGINVLALNANGANPTWAQITSMPGLVDSANAPDSARNWLINPTTKSYFQALPKVGGYPAFVLDGGDQIAGYGYASTSQVPNNLTKGSGTGLSAMAFGAWTEMLVAMFSGIDLYIDPFSVQPHVNITMAIDYDVQIAHTQSFAICLDVKTV